MPIPCIRQCPPIGFYKLLVLFLLLCMYTLPVHGETGCGKSSRVPVMLYKDSSKTKPVKLFVSQPRRIACTALHSRLSEELGWFGRERRLCVCALDE